jgi:putative transposase
LQRQLGAILRERCRPRGVELGEGPCRPAHVQLGLSMPPKYSVAQTLGFVKGKRAVRIHREWRQERRMTGLPFWAVGYWVSTVGVAEAQVRQYLREQEELAQRQGELAFAYPHRPQWGLPYVHAPKGGFLTLTAPSEGPS